MPSVRWYRLALACLFVVVAASDASAQVGGDKMAESGTRAQLEAEARVADSLHRTAEAFRLHSRLKNGDFDVGDVVGVSYEGVGLQRVDSLVVRAGRILPLPEPMGDLNLTGILRSELVDSVSARVARYYKNEVVHVHTSLRLSVSGEVPRPGFYYVAADAPLGDAIMRTGGQMSTSDPRNVVIRRGDQTVWNADDVQTALASGVTLQALDLQPGDEIVVGAKHKTSWLTIASVAGSVLGVTFALLNFLRR